MFDHLIATKSKFTGGRVWTFFWNKEKPQVILGPARLGNHCPSSFIFKLTRRPRNEHCNSSIAPKSSLEEK